MSHAYSGETRSAGPEGGRVLPPVIALVARLGRSHWLALIFGEVYSFAGLFASMSGLKALYPITAVFCVSGYYSASPGERAVSLAVLLLCGGLAALILRGTGRHRRIRQSDGVEPD